MEEKLNNGGITVEKLKHLLKHGTSLKQGSASEQGRLCFRVTVVQQCTVCICTVKSGRDGL